MEKNVLKNVHLPAQTVYHIVIALNVKMDLVKLEAYA